MLSKENLSDQERFPAYSSESANNGIVGYTNNPEFICDERHPVFVIFGDHTRNFHIADKSFSVLDNVKVLLPCVNDYRSLLWIITAWQKQIPNLGYARHWKIARNCVLELPVKEGGIDFDFMESFIAELEAGRIAELEAERIMEQNAYLKVSGLDHYELSGEERQALQNYNTLEFKEFKYQDIFNNIKQGRRLKKDEQIPGEIPFIMAGITNTGVVNYVSNPVASFPGNSITIDIFGNTFYRNYAFGAGDDTGVYWNSEKSYSKELMMFFAASMCKSIKRKYSYSKKLRSSQSLNLKMKLPVIDGKPDDCFMETLISAVQKLVIKEAVQYAGRKIEAAKTVASRKAVSEGEIAFRTET